MRPYDIQAFRFRTFTSATARTMITPTKAAGTMKFGERISGEAGLVVSTLGCAAIDDSLVVADDVAEVAVLVVCCVVTLGVPT